MRLSELELHLIDTIDTDTIHLIAEEFKDLKKQKSILKSTITELRKNHKSAMERARNSKEKLSSPLLHVAKRTCHSIWCHLSASPRVYVFYKLKLKEVVCVSKKKDTIQRYMNSDEYEVIGAFEDQPKPAEIIKRIESINEEVTA